MNRRHSRHERPTNGASTALGQKQVQKKNILTALAF